jgi:antirestriction protein ArdC
MNEKTKKPIDVYSIVTNRIIEHLEKGVVPWRQPWAEAGMPKNLVSGKQYRGINLMLLASLHYSKNIFLTFKQAKELGGAVKKGEKSCPVIFWKQLERENKDTKEIKRIPFLQYYNVFNIDQCEGIPKEKLPQITEIKNDPIQSCEEIIAKMPSKPEIRHMEHRAYYSPKEDYVNMPEMKTFIDSSSYYGTLFHELIHSSGHTSRLNRKEVMEMNGFGSESYSIEELTAEIGASYLKSCAGIPIENIENSSAYIQHWLDRLKNDKKFIVHASAQAQKATDFILDVREVEKELELNKNSERKNDLEKIREIGNGDMKSLSR